MHSGKVTDDQLWSNQPLSRLSDLLIGSCWRGGKEGEGKRINRLPAMEKTFLVDTSKIKILKLNEPVELNGVVYKSVLPPGAIKLKNSFSRMQHALYAVVPVLNDYQTQFLVISCYELYRAYTGVSSRFANNVLHKNISKYFEWNDPTLKVKTRLSRLEQFVAYRGHYNQEGRNWFNMPSNYLRAINTANQTLPQAQQKPLVIKSIFPFNGRTTLKVAGKAFKNTQGNQFVWCVFAANLLHCAKEAEFEPLIETDTFSQNPLPWEADVSSLPEIDNPFEDEDTPETDEQPSAMGRKLALLDSSNFFGAMRGLKFHRTYTGESTDPVYENDLGDDIDAYSREELGSQSEDGTSIPQESHFDSHVYNVDRKLSDFIKMIIAFRGLITKHGWKVTTRSRGSSIITVESEIVTTFLSSQNARRKWHRIQEGDQSRLRQIAWVEIAINEEQFIYLMEMELKESETGRSTLCIIAKDLAYMDEEDFKIFLEMTAVQNRWPREEHTWKTDKVKGIADNYFTTYQHSGISHPWSSSKNEADEKIFDSKALTAWATDMETNLLQKLGLE